VRFSIFLNHVREQINSPHAGDVDQGRVQLFFDLLVMMRAELAVQRCILFLLKQMTI
jgi:hypothetical protein